MKKEKRNIISEYVALSISIAIIVLGITVSYFSLTQNITRNIVELVLLMCCTTSIIVIGTISFLCIAVYLLGKDKD